MSNDSAAKIRMMKLSLRCLVLGLLGLLPLIGVPFALAALWVSSAARRPERSFWNPARPHRILGLICASFGLLVWSIADVVLIFQICSS